MPELFRFDQGENTAADRSELKTGELQKSVGVYYKPSDRRAHMLPGRSLFGASGEGSEKVLGVGLCQYDSGGTDSLLAYVNETLYSATPGASGTLSSLVASLSSSATGMTLAQSLNRWFWGNGWDRNRVIKSDGTARFMGMIAPQEQPVALAGGGAGTSAGYADNTESSSNVTNPDNAWEATGELFASFTLDTIGTTATATYSWDTSDANVDYVSVQWGVFGDQFQVEAADEDGGVADVGIGGGPGPTFIVRATIEVSEDDGATAFTRVLFQRLKSPTGIYQNLQIPVAVDQNLVRVKVTLEYQFGQVPATLRLRRVYSVDADAGAVTAFTTTTGLYYAVSEWSEDDGISSPLSPATPLVEMSDDNTVTLTMPTARNTNSTHWLIWRTADGGTVPLGFGLLDNLDINETTYVDDFTIKDHQTRPAGAPPIIIATDKRVSAGELYFSRDEPPPAFRHMNAFRGSLVATSLDAPRTLFYSIAGRPESWPTIYRISAFMSDVRDELVATVTVGDTLLIGAKGRMLTMPSLPRVSNGVFDASEPDPLPKQPGLVGVDAITELPRSVTGGSSAAWVSPFGIHITNTITSDRITDDADWSTKVQQSTLSTAVLRWNQDWQAIVFAYDDADGNRRWALIHMSGEHKKQNGQPKITWGHYGSISSYVSGLVGDVFRVYTGHSSNGSVYLEHTGTSDASNSYDGSGNLRMDITTGRRYFAEREATVFSAYLQHTDATGESITATWKAGRDLNAFEEYSEDFTVSLTGHGRTEFSPWQSGAWHECTLAYTGQSSFSLLSLGTSADLKGGIGKANTA